MPSVYCTQCGRANPEDARFCSSCGSPLSGTGPAPVGTAEQAGPFGDAERGRADWPGGSDRLPPADQNDSTSTLSLGGVEALDGEPGEEIPADQAAAEALPPGTALLVVKRGPNAGSRFLLDSERTTAGRHPESDIFLDDVTVSRRHAEFLRQGRQFLVRDVGSLNGTYVNRERIDQLGLSGGDEVQVGKFRLVFLTNPSHAAESAS
jgi:hypothetical protein